MTAGVILILRKGLSTKIATCGGHHISRLLTVALRCLYNEAKKYWQPPENAWNKMLPSVVL